MSVSYYGSDGEEKTATGTAEITVTDADKDNSNITVTLTMRDSARYFAEIERDDDGWGGCPSLSSESGIARVSLPFWQGFESDASFTLHDFVAAYEIKTGDAVHLRDTSYTYTYGDGGGSEDAAPEGAQVTPYFSIEAGCYLKSYTVTNDTTGESAEYPAASNDEWSAYGRPFTMPASSVTVTPTIQYGFSERTVTVRLDENSSQVQGMSMRYYDSNREWKTVEGTTEVTATDVADMRFILSDGGELFKYDTVSVTVTMKDGRRYFAKTDPVIDNSPYGSHLSSRDGILGLDIHSITSDTVFTLYDFVAASYRIEVGETEHGSIYRLGITYGDTYSSFSASEDAILAPEGAQISLVSSLDEGYYLKSCIVTSQTTGESIEYPVPWPDGSAIASSFTMPGSDVTVTPVFAPITVIDTIEIGNVSADIAASDGELSALVPFTGAVDPDAPYTLNPNSSKNSWERWVRMSDGGYVVSNPDAELAR